ncbi:MAG: acyl-CoA dehydrogenase [Candidatus Thermofonsia Clade 1 bacterium]|uniref:Acyl-CoA dehydrogenase n=1 Tax=Candidatus Thermofonsia Clade 1 bacterium TaxID=2364210 RepID=A0A2M8NY90_9CHLR|nr:MAG: acyl-CoA dehydrogenase [Candidatus Thermofonsia Clade 1 bacterium]
MANVLTATLSAVDFYRLDDLLTPEEREVRYLVRDFMAREVEPIINSYWERAEFPFEIIPKLAALNLAGATIKGYGCRGLSQVAMGVMAMEFARGDASISTFFGVHSGLAMGSIDMLGSEAQKERWLPAMARMELLGCFGLTEPQGGSNAAHPLTTAVREGDHYILNGAKRWIGNATLADLAIIFARNTETNQVNAFVVEPKKMAGYTATPIEGKIAKRAIINADVKLENVVVPAENRLERCNSFRDVAKVLMVTRVGVAWEAVGAAMAAYEYALAYAKQRVVFGKPIAGFQMIQDKLVQMLGEITSMQLFTLRLSQLADEGKLTDGQASLAKVHNAAAARRVVALGREIMGGNGILLENHVARHFADMEAVYTYEGTNEINTLVVGREITGISAIV